MTHRHVITGGGGGVSLTAGCLTTFPDTDSQTIEQVKDGYASIINNQHVTCFGFET